MATSSRAGVLASYVEAWQAGDVDRLFDHCANDIVLHYGGTSAFAGDHAGRDRAIAVLVETSLRSRRGLVAVEDVFETGDRGAVFVREALTTEGVRREVRRALRFRITGDRIVECWLYDQDQHLVDQAWSNEAEPS